MVVTTILCIRARRYLPDGLEIEHLWMEERWQLSDHYDGFAGRDSGS
jgi:hypothetical protein